MMRKKTHPTFSVPNYGAKKRKRVKARWRKQRGIDSKKRIKKNFMGAEPTIGYGNPESIRGMRSNGKRIMIVRNPNELRTLIKENRLNGYDVTIANGVSIRKRIEMTMMAEGSRIRITNGAYK